jgi:hypothetical protein
MLRLPHMTPRFDPGAAHGITTGSRDATSCRMGSQTLIRGKVTTAKMHSHLGTTRSLDL